MKNLPYILNLNGTAMILLVCGDNRRFRPLGSHVNVENVTCLSRGSFIFVYTCFHWMEKKKKAII